MNESVQSLMVVNGAGGAYI